MGQDMWEYRFKVPTKEGDEIKDLAAELGMTIKGLMEGGIELMRQNAHSDLASNLAIAVVNELHSRGLVQEHKADAVSTTYFD